LHVQFRLLRTTVRAPCVLGDLLNLILERQPQIIAETDHALVIHGQIPDLRDHIPVLSGYPASDWYVCPPPCHGPRIQFEKSAQGGVFQRLQPSYIPGFRHNSRVDGLQKQLNLLARDDVADIVRMVSLLKVSPIILSPQWPVRHCCPD